MDVRDDDIERLLVLHNLKELAIVDASSLTAKSILNFGRLKQLKSLWLAQFSSDVTTLDPLRELQALCLYDCDMRHLKPDFTSDLPSLSILHLDDVTLTAPSLDLLANLKHLVDLEWGVKLVAADGGLAVEAQAHTLLRGSKSVRKLVLGNNVPNVDYSFMPCLEHLSVNLSDPGAFSSSDFEHLQSLKTLQIINVTDDELTVSLMDIIQLPNDFFLLPKLERLFISHIDLDEDNNEEFFASIPSTLKTMGWNEWPSFKDSLCDPEMGKEFAASAVEFFTTRFMKGLMRISKDEQETLHDDLSLLVDDLPGHDFTWVGWDNVTFLKKFGCTLPWALV
jgi:hypothetical protein